jgi:hypothetical protein
MTLSGDYLKEMQRLPLDLDTADRLLDGSVPADDAPPGYAGVAVLLTEASSLGDEIALDDGLIAVLADTVRSSPTPKTTSPRRSIVPRLKLAAALTGALLVGTAGLAVAGSLPGAAQDVASEMLAKVGITAPGPNTSAGDHPNTRGSSEQTSVTTASSGKGTEISGLATSDLKGLDKGAAVSSAASEGKSRAGEEQAAPEETSAPVETPNSGGTGTADTASGGRSTTGSGNATEGQSHHP